MEIREMLDLNPSFAETRAAKAAFLQWLKAHEAVISLPESDPQHMSRDVAMSCALAEVWRQGRRYQRDQNNAALMALAGLEVGVKCQ